MKILEVLDEQFSKIINDAEDFKLAKMPEEDDDEPVPSSTLQARRDSVLFVTDSIVLKKLRLDMFRIDYGEHFSKGKRYIEPEKSKVIPLRAKMLIKLNKMYYQVFRVINQGGNRLGSSDSR